MQLQAPIEILSRHERNLSKAAAQALKSRYRRWPMGAVIVKSGRLLARACNEQKNSPSIPGMPANRCSVHAEAAVLRLAEGRGATVYVARMGRRGQRALARPCSACEELLRSHGVRQVVWTIDDHSYGVTNL